MRLHEVLRKVAIDLGHQVLTENNIVNIVSDYDTSAFDPPSFKSIIKVMVSEGYLKRLFLTDGLNDIKENQLKNELIEKHGFQMIQIDYIIDSFKYGLGLIQNVKPYSLRKYEEDGNLDKTIIKIKAQRAAEEELKKIIGTKEMSNKTQSANSNPPRKTTQRKKRKNNYNGCGCIIIGIIVLGLLGLLYDNFISKESYKGENYPDTIMLVRTEMDTLRWNDGSPKEMKSIKKGDIMLILAKDTLYIATPYKSEPKLNIRFKDKIYNKETKEMQEEHNYSFTLISNNDTLFLYGKPQKLLPIVEQNQVNNRIDHIIFKYPPEKYNEYQAGGEYEHRFYFFTSGIEEKIGNYFSVFK